MNNTINIGVIGQAASGKTTLIKANSESFTKGVGVFTTDTYLENFTHTIKLIDFIDVMWDVNKRAELYGQMDAMIVMVDLLKKRDTKEFADEEQWLAEARKYGKANIPVVLVGSKYDLLAENPGEMDFIHAFARKHNLVFYPSSTADPETLVFPVSNLLDKLIHGGDDF